MKILVPVKRVVDFNVRIRVKPDGSGVETANVKMSINPFDEIAVEEAVRLKEKGIATEVIVVTIGSDATQDVLRSALAMGADRAILITADSEIQPLTAAKLLKAIVAKEQPQLVITGKQAIDDDANQTGQMLAGLLGWGQGTFASKIEFPPPVGGRLGGGRSGTTELVSPHPSTVKNRHPDVDCSTIEPPPKGEGDILVTREIDGGLMTVKLKLPAVVTTDLRLNEPRYAALPNIMKARSKPLAKMTVQELGVDVATHLKILKLEEPKKRKGGTKVGSVEELVDKLKNEAKVI